jgi:hypothetical protein
MRRIGAEAITVAAPSRNKVLIHRRPVVDFQ